MKQTKHAFLIMAHTAPEQLSLLLRFLDHPRADLYLHVDQRASFQPEDFAQEIKHSGFFAVPRRKVSWGGRSQIECELSLIEQALGGEYAYYHLISGQDLVLCTMDRFFSFFDQNEGKEFVSFDSPVLSNGAEERMRYYWLFQEKEREGGLWYRFNHSLVSLQKKCGTDRRRKDFTAYYKGANWFSCTHSFMKHVAKQKKDILKHYRFTRCCDEIFLQTCLMSSPFRENLYDKSFSDSPFSNMRMVDWKRGTPYTFRGEDVPSLLQSGLLFGRKFDLTSYPEAVYGVFNALKSIES